MFTLILVFCLFASSGVASAQNDWDSVLDRYESITAQCKALRDKVAAGEPVSQKSVTSLFGELGRLRNMLQQSSGKMTKAQRDRFERIRRSYDGSVPAGALQRPAGEPQRPVGEPVEPPALRQAQGPGNPAGEPLRPVGEPVEPPATTDGPVLRLARVKIEPLPKVVHLLTLAPSTMLSPFDNALGPRPAGELVEPPVLRLLRQAQQPQGPERIEARGPGRKSWDIIALATFGDAINYGIHASYVPGRWGGYFSLRTNLKSQLYAFEILSDGTTGGEGRFEAKGGQRLGEYSASAGVVRTVTPWMDLYAGAGYGSSTLCWNDIHGAWAKVRDYSAAGLLLDGGAVFHIGKFSLLGGVSYLTARPEAGPFRPVFTVGAGFAF